MMPECCKPQTKEGVFHPLMMFDCKGYEPVDFVFGGGWKAESVSVFYSSSHRHFLFFIVAIQIYRMLEH